MKKLIALICLLAFFHLNAANIHVKSKEEKEWLTEFFKEVLLENFGIYTLWGSKPITELEMDDFSQEEILSMNSNASEEERQNGLMRTTKYKLIDLWNRWEKARDQLPMTRYLLFAIPNEEPKIQTLFFVDKLKVAEKMTDHYALFRKELGHEFEPIDLVFTISDPGSEFWIKIMSNTLLSGILYGYGEKNACRFNWEMKTSTSSDAQSLANLLSSKRKLSEDVKSYYGKATIRHFSIPTFVSFSNNDEVIERYRAERKRIQKIYKGKDFVDLTLQKLCSDL